MNRKGLSHKVLSKIVRDKTLLAVFTASDDDGLVCYATNWQLAQLAGLGAATVKYTLRQLGHERVIETFQSASSGRRIVLMDHRDAKETCGQFRERFGLSVRENQAREERLMLEGH